MKGETKILLSEREMPTRWYNLAADLPEPRPPMLHPVTLQPLAPPDLAPIFRDEPDHAGSQPGALHRHPGGGAGHPQAVAAVAPAIRARRLEKALGTPAKIYYKYEGVSPAGSHKPNTAVAQAYYNKKAGMKRLATETGAGQWGSALSMACNFFGHRSARSTWSRSATSRSPTAAS